MAVICQKYDFLSFCICFQHNMTTSFEVHTLTSCNKKVMFPFNLKKDITFV